MLLTSSEAAWYCFPTISGAECSGKMSGDEYKNQRVYLTLSDEEKLDFLRKEDPFRDWENLDDPVYCLHCDEQFTERSIKVYEERGERFVACGTEGCDGAPHDWAPRPWWREDEK
jgi:hypothetical protein